MRCTIADMFNLEEYEMLNLLARVMTTGEVVFGIILMVVSVALILIVLFQHGRSANISGAIAGGAETFFGKSKGRTLDSILSKLTSLVAILFIVLTLVITWLSERAG